MNIFQNHRDSFALRRNYARRNVPMMAGMSMALAAYFFSPTAALAMPDSAAAPSTTPSPAPVTTPATNAPAPAQTERHFFIEAYQVQGGGHLIPKLDVEAAVYPYLGPYRTAGDVEQARGALEQAFRDKGFQTVTVIIPEQVVKARGVISLQVMQGEVGRLRVHGSRYFSIDQIKREAPSLQEGQSPNFSQVTHDLLVLNGMPDRRVTPTLRAGVVPGTVDVDLNVKDTIPLHGSLEINNRYSADTTQLRINGSVNYDNLWQLGHSIGLSFQISPEDVSQVKVFSGYYLAHIPDVNWLSLMVQGTYQDSDVSTLGGIGVVGKGGTIGGRAIITLPNLTDYYHSVSLGFDWKDLSQNETTSSTGTISSAPVTYFPISAAYSGTWAGKGYETDLNSSVNLAFSTLGSAEVSYDLRRHGAGGDFIYVRGDLSHQRDLPGGFQIFVKGQGQVSDQPLIDAEEFSAGGVGTVRGYLESEVQGDEGVIGSAEFRSPSLGDLLGKSVDDWRFYVFSEAAFLTIQDVLPEQQSDFKLASVGLGTRFKFVDHLNGSFDAGLPLDNSTTTNAYETQLTFRLWADF